MVQIDASLSRRELELMQIVYRLGSATAAQCLGSLPDPPSYSAVRATLSLLEKKGRLKHKQDGPRYIYFPVVSRDRAKKSALNKLLHTFFADSVEEIVAALLTIPKKRLSESDLNRLSKMIEEARREGR